MENYPVIYGFNKVRLKKNGNVTLKKYLKESLSTILYIIIQGKGSSGKGLNLKFILLRTW